MLGFSVNTAMSAIVPISAWRSVWCLAYAYDLPYGEDYDEEEYSGSEFGHFDYSFTADASIGSASAASTAAQESEIGENGVYAVGSASIELAIDEINDETVAFARGHSSFRLEFDVPSPVQYAVTGYLEYSSPYDGYSMVRLEGPNGVVFEHILGDPGAGLIEYEAVNETGTLECGIYELRIVSTCEDWCTAEISYGRSGSYDITMQLEPVTACNDQSLATLAGIVLHPAYPNPFNPRTTIAFTTPRSLSVDLRVYDLSGQLVRTLIEGETLPMGRHERAWQGRDDRGRSVAAGVYLYRLETGVSTQSQRLLLVK
jgi:hypothetical protein